MLYFIHGYRKSTALSYTNTRRRAMKKTGPSCSFDGPAQQKRNRHVLMTVPRFLREVLLSVVPQFSRMKLFSQRFPDNLQSAVSHSLS